MMNTFILAYYLKTVTQLVCKTLPQRCSVLTDCKYHRNSEQETEERFLSFRLYLNSIMNIKVSRSAEPT